MKWFLAVLTGKYAYFEGRAGRPEFWYFFLVSLVITVVAGSLSIIAGSFFDLIYFVVSLAMLLPYIGVGIRRLHDRDMSGWWMLLILIPITGIVLLIIQALPGTPGPNRFGEGPERLD